jgi:hypothetical protein
MKMSIEDEIANHMAQQISAEIDKELVNQLLEEIEKDKCMIQGWVKAPFTTANFKYDVLYDVSAWIHINATDEYKIFGKEFWFKSPKDLTAFVLKWA